MEKEKSEYRISFSGIKTENKISRSPYEIFGFLLSMMLYIVHKRATEKIRKVLWKYGIL